MARKNDLFPFFLSLAQRQKSAYLTLSTISWLFILFVDACTRSRRRHPASLFALQRQSERRMRVMISKLCLQPRFWCVNERVPNYCTYAYVHERTKEVCLPWKPSPRNSLSRTRNITYGSNLPIRVSVAVGDSRENALWHTVL